jgi:hypothetical protein
VTNIVAQLDTTCSHGYGQCQQQQQQWQHQMNTCSAFHCTICPISDVAGEQLSGDSAAVLPAASTDLRAGSVSSRLQRGAVHHAAAARPEFR